MTKKIKEEFLHNQWKSNRLIFEKIFTTDGKKLEIINIGTANTNAGPDFLNAHIKIADTELHGHIEIHIDSSDWIVHKHDKNTDYDNVILHVVWNNNKKICYSNGKYIPTIELKNYIDINVFKQYVKLIYPKKDIPCSSYLQDIEEIYLRDMLEKSLFQKLTKKNELIYNLLEETNYNWEETMYHIIAYNLGYSINHENFLQLSKISPLNILKKNSDNIEYLEALLFGQAGLLNDKPRKKDDYFETLSKNYQFLKSKYSLPDSPMIKSQWKFFRLRPKNFPTIRISQLAQIIKENHSIFDLIINNSSEMIIKKLTLKQSKYWTTHHIFGKKSNKKSQEMGIHTIHNLIINSIVPLLVAYGKYKDDEKYIDRALNILKELPYEKNKIIRLWQSCGQNMKTAYDSQAYIGLYTNYCQEKKCLNCAIGSKILSRNVKINKEKKIKLLQ